MAVSWDAEDPPLCLKMTIDMFWVPCYYYLLLLDDSVKWGLVRLWFN